MLPASVFIYTWNILLYTSIGIYFKNIFYFCVYRLCYFYDPNKLILHWLIVYIHIHRNHAKSSIVGYRLLCLHTLEIYCYTSIYFKNIFTFLYIDCYFYDPNKPILPWLIVNLLSYISGI